MRKSINQIGSILTVAAMLLFHAVPFASAQEASGVYQWAASADVSAQDTVVLADDQQNPLVTLSFGEAMSYKSEKALQAEGYTGVIYGSTNPSNPKPSETGLPGGAVFKFTAETDGTLGVAYQLNAGKSFYICREDSASSTGKTYLVGEDPEYQVSVKTNETQKIQVEQGGVYYVYCAGSKLSLFGFTFSPGSGEPGGETPPPGEETPPPGEETPPPGEETPPPGEETPPPSEETPLPDTPGETTIDPDGTITWRATDKMKAEQLVVLKDEKGEKRITLTLGEDMSFKGDTKSIPGFKGYINGTTNPSGGKPNEEGLPAGAVFIFTPETDGVITVAYQLSANKNFFICKGDQRTEEKTFLLGEDPEYLVPEKVNETKAFEVEQGGTYYVYCAGSKLGLFGFSFLSTSDAKPTPPPSGSDLEQAQEDAATLELDGFDSYAIYMDVILPSKGSVNGSAVTWESSNERYISVKKLSSNSNYTGVVTRPKPEECDESGGVPVTLTATVKLGSASYQREFEVNVRKWNPLYYNDFQGDVGQEPTEDYPGIQDNVTPVSRKNPEPFRGIRVAYFKQSKCFENWSHADIDREAYFDKRIISTDQKYGKPGWSEKNQENFAFYFEEHTAYGGSTTYNTAWINLIDPETGQAPQGTVMMGMDIYLRESTPNQRLSMGFGTSKGSQMCRFTLYTDNGLRYGNSDAETTVGGYKVPGKKWIKVYLIGNSKTHLWDLYFDGRLIKKNINFRNAEDQIPTIEFTMDRGRDGGSYLIDNIYVENLTEDYNDMYWETFRLSTLPYDEATDSYRAEKPFMLNYSFTGYNFVWRSSNSSLLKTESVMIPAEELADYGYTQEQIQAYLDKGIKQVTINRGVPNNNTGQTQTVTLTGYIDVNGGKSRDFTIQIPPTGSGGAEAEIQAKLKADLAAIDSVHDGMVLTKKQPLPLEKKGSVHGSAFTWRSSNSVVIASSGAVTMPNSKKEVTLTVVAVLDGVSESRNIRVTVDPGNTSKPSQSGGGGGGSANPVTKATAAPTATPEATADPEGTPPPGGTLEPSHTPEPQKGFRDTPLTPWAQEAIDALTEQGILSGYGDGTFGVNDTVTREQLMKILINAFGLEAEDAPEAGFGDVDPGQWYAEYVNTAAALGILTGTGDNRAGVGEAVTRQDLAVFCARALEAKGAWKPSQGALSFGDADQIADYAKEAAAAMAELGYIQGDENNNFAPEKPATRAETAVIIYRMIR